MYITVWMEVAKKDYDSYLWLNDDAVLELNVLVQILECSVKRSIMLLYANYYLQLIELPYWGRIKKKIAPVNGRIKK